MQWTNVVILVGMAVAFSGCSKKQTAHVKRDSRKTFDTGLTLDKVADEVEKWILQTGEIPEESDGQRIVEATKDEWQQNLVYQPGEGDVFMVISVGQDGQLGTRDDVRCRRKATETIHIALAPINSIMALNYLKSDNDMRRHKAIAWMIDTPPVESEKDREELFARCLTHIHSDTLRSEVMKAVERWAQPMDVKRIGYRLRIASTPEETEFLTKLLAKLNGQSQLIPLMNISDDYKRELVSQTLSSMPVDGTLVVHQCVMDLDNLSRQKSATRHLLLSGIPEDQKTEVAEDLGYFLKRDTLTSECAELIDLIESLGPEGVAAMAMGVANETNHVYVAKRLEKHPEAEPQLLSLLKERLQESAYRRIMRILQKIGTDQSVPPLRKLVASRPELNELADETIKLIQQRGLASSQPTVGSNPFE